MRNANYVVLKTIITGPGQYVTRCGETVTIKLVLDGQPYGALGSYDNGGDEAWDVSGRLYPSILSDNDIVGQAVEA